jgi:hypothetical protein
VGSLNSDVRGDPPLGSKRLDRGPLSRRLLVNRAIDRSGPRAMHTYSSPCQGGWVLGVKGRFGQVLNTRWASRGDLPNTAVGRMAGECGTPVTCWVLQTVGGYRGMRKGWLVHLSLRAGQGNWSQCCLREVQHRVQHRASLMTENDQLRGTVMAETETRLSLSRTSSWWLSVAVYNHAARKLTR